MNKNKKIGCLVLALALILTASLALAATHHTGAHTFHYDHPYDNNFGSVPKDGKFVVDTASCYDTGIIYWLCDQSGVNDPTKISKEDFGDEVHTTHIPAVTHNYGVQKDGSTPLDPYGTMHTVNGELTVEDAVALIDANQGNVVWKKKPTCAEGDAGKGILQIKCIHADKPWGKLAVSIDDPSVTEWIEYQPCHEVVEFTVQALTTGHIYSRSPQLNTKVDLNHDELHDNYTKYFDEYLTVDPTCTEDGYEYAYCLRCQQQINEHDGDVVKIKCLGHDWKNVDELAPATCVQGARVIGECKRCGHVDGYDTKINPDAHQPGELLYDENNAPTCTKAGIAHSTCQLCKKPLKGIPVKALGHVIPTYTNYCNFNGLKDAGKNVPADQVSRYVDQCERCGTWLFTKLMGNNGWQVYALNQRPTGTTIAELQIAGFANGGKPDYSGTNYVHRGEIVPNYQNLYNGPSVTDQTGEITFNPNAARYSSDVYDYKETCTRAAVIHPKCEACGWLFELQEVQPKGHDNDQAVTFIAPTCEDAGMKALICSRVPTEQIYENGKIKSDILSQFMAAKDWVAFETGANAPHSAEGQTVTINGKQVTYKVIYESIPPLGHDWGEWHYDWQPEGEVGTAWRECTQCLERQTVPYVGFTEVCPVSPDGHHSEFHHDAVEPDCWNDGLVESDFCDFCHMTPEGIFLDEEAFNELIIPALNHDEEICGRVIEYGDGSAPTCTEDGIEPWIYCAACGYWLNPETAGQPLPATHDFEYHEAKAPTCTAEGNAAYYTCSVCGKIFAVDEASGENAPGEELEAVPTIAMVEHTWVDVEAVEPTYTEKGHTAGKTCSVCGATEGQEEIPCLTGLHADATGKVNYYANGAIDTTFAGMVDFEGGKFYVKDGAVDTSLNGVSNVALESDGVFYFFSNGQVQLGANGRAEYDGEHFVVKNGVVQTGYTGTFEEAGQTFWVAAGRLCLELNGVHCEDDGVYVYGEGRRTPCEGLAEYMGSMFYFEKGKMVSATMDYVDFNGNTWRVVNGQAYPMY